jgi:O-antigen/teichoic acid export membrane protein
MDIGRLFSLEALKLAVLYGSKFVGAVTGFVFMPVYLGLMGADDFSIVAVIVSLQAVAILLDFGVQTTIGRDLVDASAGSKPRLRALLDAEGALVLLYLSGGVVVVAGLALWHQSPAQVPLSVGVLLLLLGVVLQGLHGAALIALSRFFEGALCNAATVLLRALCTWAALAWVSPSVETFVAAQAVCSLAGAWVSRVFSMRHVRPPGETTFRRASFSVANGVELVKRSRALMVSSLVGAAATQLDKSILLGHVSAQELSAYFLAHAIGSMPLAIVATPIVQYFQPKVFAVHDPRGNPALTAVLRRFAACIVLSMGGVALCFAVFGHTLIAWWLPDRHIAQLVMAYADLLVVAYLVAGVGYIPYVMMVAERGYAFNARLAVLAAACLLGAVVLAAFRSSAQTACMAFIGYYTVVTTGLFWRMFRK